MKSKQQTYAGILLPQEVVEGLEEVKLVLSDALSTSDKRLSGIFNTITSSVGKMRRPAFLMLFANFNGEISRSNIILSAAIEMVHTASLLHDDVVDNACRRRDNCSFNSRFGSKIAILAGDYVVSSAFLLADDVADKKLFQMFFETMALMSKAELLQNANHNNFDIDQDTYFKIINGKTAALFAKACMIGALNCQQQSDKQAAEEFGSHFGIAYQLVNDYCDVFGKDHSGCAYSAKKLYFGFFDMGHYDWPVNVLISEFTREALTEALETGPYGRCVYSCDNDVVDNQAQSRYLN